MRRLSPHRCATLPRARSSRARKMGARFGWPLTTASFSSRATTSPGRSPSLTRRSSAGYWTGADVTITYDTGIRCPSEKPTPSGDSDRFSLGVKLEHPSTPAALHSEARTGRSLGGEAVAGRAPDLAHRLRQPGISRLQSPQTVLTRTTLISLPHRSQRGVVVRAPCGGGANWLGSSARSSASVGPDLEPARGGCGACGVRFATLPPSCVAPRGIRSSSSFLA